MNHFLAALCVGDDGIRPTFNKNNKRELSWRFQARASENAIHDAVISQNFSDKAIAKLIAIVGNGSPSPLGQATWEEVLEHTVSL